MTISRVGFIGLGNMGTPMAGHLAAACASASIAAKTSAALRNASSAAGPPQ